MKVLKWFLIAIVSLAAIFLVGGFMIPSTWTVTESATIKASPETIYNQVANLRNWQNWAPWNKEKDPTQVYTYEGPEVGPGATWKWTSEKMGTGYLKILDGDVHQGIDYELFIDMGDMQSTMYGKMAFSAVDEGTHLVWTDKGESGNNLVKRWMSLMIKSMLSKEFKEGLAKLKSVTEAQ